MKKQILFILSFLSIGQFTVSDVDAFGFGKLASQIKAAAKSNLGQAIAATAAEAVGEKNPVAGALFANATNSMHAAVQEEESANKHDEYADTAENAGEDETAASHRTLAKKHRENSENHREIHKNLVAQLKNKHGVDFHAQYKQHVLPAIQSALESSDDEESDSEEESDEETDDEESEE